MKTIVLGCICFIFSNFNLLAQSNLTEMGDCEFWINLDDQFATENSVYHEYIYRKLPYIIKDYHNITMENGKPLKFYEFTWYTCVDVAYRSYQLNGNKEEAIYRFYAHLNRANDLELTIDEDFLFELITSKIFEEKLKIFNTHNHRIYDLMMDRLQANGYPTSGNKLGKHAAAKVFYHYNKDIELQKILQ